VVNRFVNSQEIYSKMVIRAGNIHVGNQMVGQFVSQVSNMQAGGQNSGILHSGGRSIRCSTINQEANPVVDQFVNSQEINSKVVIRTDNNHVRNQLVSQFVSQVNNKQADSQNSSSLHSGGRSISWSTINQEANPVVDQFVDK
jgi:hypothetical protein